MRLGPLALALLFAAVGALGCSDGRASRSRVLVVGWDGATFDLLDPLLRAGRLPNLAALVERGQSAALTSTRIPISSAAWPTIATGVGPGVHGVYGFLRPEANPWDARLVSAMDVDAPPLWRILSHRGRRVNVVGVPVTYPPEPVDGTLVAGMLSPFDADYAWPPGTADALRARGFVPDVGLWRQDEVADLGRVREQLRLKREILLELVREDDWSLSFLVFKSLDVLCHRPHLALGGREIQAHLEELDAILGDLVAAAGADTTVIVVSDHGFARYAQVFNVHRWLIDAGFAVQKEGAALSAGPKGDNLAEKRALTRAARLESLELARCRAVAEVAEGPFCAIRVPRAGREPGATATAEEVERTFDELEAALRAIRTPGGDPLVTDIWRGADLYPGPYADAVVPDLIVGTRTNYRCVTDPLAPALSPSQIPYPDHALDGVLVVAGPRVGAASVRGRFDLVDVAPLVLHALGEPIPSTMTGVAAARALLEGPAPSTIAAPDDPSLVPTAAVFADRAPAEESAEVRSRIGQIGYGR